MTDQDHVGLVANTAVDGAVLETPKASNGVCSLYKGLAVKH